MKKIICLTFIIITLLVGCGKKTLLSVYIIDVGQGDSILIQTPNKTNILVDGGDEDTSLIIKKFLKSKKVKTIDFPPFSSAKLLTFLTNDKWPKCNPSKLQRAI